jgi:hypothetical protein
MATERTTERQQTMSTGTGIATTGGTITQEQITGPAKGTPAEYTDRVQSVIAGAKLMGNTSVLSDAIWLGNYACDDTGVFYTADGLPKTISQGRRRSDQPTTGTGLNLAEAQAHGKNLAAHVQQLRRGKLTGDAATRVLDAIETDADWFASVFAT